jgi:DNA-binding FrmR family transcriptional regulator
MNREHKDKLLNRLNRVEGQVRGVARMIEEGRYCIDVLTQISAVKAAIARVESEVLKDHLQHCVRGAMTGDDAADRDKKVAELIELLERGR